VLTAAGLAIIAAIVLVISIGLFHVFVARPAASVPNPMAAASEALPPLPHIEEHPANELQQLRVDEDRTLTTYGWVDKKAGRVRIPIDRAVELQLQRGFPVRNQEGKK
jgi:hypothetical protein